MPRPAKISRDELSRRMRQVFRSRGFDGASMETLAQETGLAKAALYHFFPGGKAEMAAAVLDGLRQWVTENVIQPLQAPGTARERLEGMADGLEKLYEGGKQPCLLGLFSSGEALSVFQTRLQTSFRTLIRTVAQVLAEAGVPQAEAERRAEDLVIRIQGALVLSRVFSDAGPFCRMRERMVDELLKGTAFEVDGRCVLEETSAEKPKRRTRRREVKKG